MEFDERVACLLKKFRDILPEEEHGGYNIFSVLEIEENEVIMCRMLADLLNPYGQHGLGNIFLKNFLKDVLDEPAALADIDRLHVTKEYPIASAQNRPDEDGVARSGDLAEGNAMPQRIDIVIHGAGHFIPIEVKINEDENGHQCRDYYNFAIDNGYKTQHIYYLTKHGSKPENSYSKLEGKCRLISFDKHIIGWLKTAAEEADSRGAKGVSNIIRQYLSSIDHFTDARRRKIMKSCAYKVMATDIEAGVAIAKSFNDIQDALITSMFTEFEKAVKDKWHVKPDDTAPKYWKKIGRPFFGKIYEGKYAPSHLCTCFKIKSDNSSPERSLYICIDQRAWADVDGNEQNYIYLPTGDIKEPEDDETAEIPNFYTMNPAALKLNDDEKMKSFIKNSIEAIEKHLFN